MGAGCSSNNKQPVNKKAPAVPGLKIVIVGDCEVGKTSVYLRFLHNQFSPIYIPSKKVNIDNVVQKINQPSHALVSLTLWDVPGREDINLHSTYFKDMDALIVVADLTDETSIRMAPVWKQLALNVATVTGEEDRIPGSVEIPILLLGNKFDEIEKQMLADLAAKDSETPKRKSLSKKQEIPKPPCVHLLEEVADKAYFTGSAVVSAKSGDGSVTQTFKAFIRHIMGYCQGIPRRWQNKVIEEKEIKSRDRQTLTMEFVQVPEFDDLFDQGQVLVTRVTSLAAHFKETLLHFQQLCVTAKVIEEDDCSLENCLLGLKEALTLRNITLKLVVQDEFCHLEARSMEDVEIEKPVRMALKAFNKEFAAVCQVSLNELPSLLSSLNILETRLLKLYETYQIPPPPPPGSKDDEEEVVECNAGFFGRASRAIGKNRAMLIHSKHQAEDLIKNMENALKKVRTAFVW